MRTYVVREEREYEVKARSDDDAMRRMLIDGKVIFQEVTNIEESEAE